MSEARDRNPGLPAWKAALLAEAGRVAERDRWGLASMGVGWVHLSCFVGLQAIHARGDRTQWHYVLAWGAELAANMLVLRHVAGRGWSRSGELASVLTRIWGTFLILSFNVAALNSVMGLSVEWCQPAWASLSTFGFAATAYLTTPWFFVSAVQMYFTGLLMATNPEHVYLIYGISWCATLQGIGLVLERKRVRDAYAALRPRPSGLFGIGGRPPGTRPADGLPRSVREPASHLGLVSPEGGVVEEHEPSVTWTHAARASTTAGIATPAASAAGSP